MNAASPVKLSTYAGVFVLTLAALMHEILLTRIFSVTLWYHFAFMAISIAMFGMTVGATWVYLRPERFREETAHAQLAAWSLGYAIATLLTFLIYLRIPILTEAGSFRPTILAASYALVSIPFVFSGVVVTIALTRFPRHVSRLYGADLIGAAAGCVLLIALLDVTDAPTAVFFVAALGALASALFAGAGRRRALRMGALATAAALLVAGTIHTQRVKDGDALVKLAYTRGKPASRPLFERWNSYSRVHVEGNPTQLRRPAGWGLSPRAPAEPPIRQLYMGIDVTAGTLITAYDGDTAPLGFLRYDVTNLAHHLRPRADVLVVGVGGGRDILSALVFEQKSVVGVEVNENVLEALRGRFARFSGHLERDPRVTFAVDEARSYLTRSDRSFDVLQISLVDTWAATAAGAFSLSENALYTVEAWEVFLRRLSETGLLSVSRWYFNASPAEFYRLASLARESLQRMGVGEPRAHVVIVKLPKAAGLAGSLGSGIGTMLVSRSPFSARDLETLREVTRDMDFEIVVDPDFAEDEVYEGILSSADPADVYASHPLDLTAPTDDRPFFFHMLRLGSVLDASIGESFDVNARNLSAVRVLALLLVIVVVLTGLFVVLPLVLRGAPGDLRGGLPLLGFFAAIGFGFMFVEISQLQRLMIFLGHPTYALSVVLFTLLLAGGLGSLLTGRIPNGSLAASGRVGIAVLLVVLVVFGAITPSAVRAFSGGATPVRVAVAAGLLFPMGLVMGMPFALGMRVASSRDAALTPWLWGVNGAASVCCSVLAVAVALTWGIAVAFWAGALCYAMALAAYVAATRG